MTVPSSYAYQWKSTKSGTTTLVGTNAATYALATTDVGATITCTVTGTNSAGAAAVTTAATPAIAAASAGGGSVAPMVVNASPLTNAGTGSGAFLRTVGSATRLKLQGCCVWGINDLVANNANTGGNNYADRTAICQAISALGGNCIRLRVLGYEYNNQQNQSQASYIQQVQGWAAACQAANLYCMICNWDSLDSPTAGGNPDGQWTTNYVQAFPLFLAMTSVLNNNPFVFYEPFNEPNNVNNGDAGWASAMQGTVQYFRQTCNYTGLLVIDPNDYAHEYSDGLFGALEVYDASVRGGTHNLAFARHDYTDDYGGNWSYGAWVNNTGGNETSHVMMETEFGNQNGSNQNNGFSQAETSGFATQMYNRSNIAGGTAFLWNWVDANSMCNLPANLINPWGNDVATWLAGTSVFKP